MANSPGGTPRNAGWTNGVIELLPIGALLDIRHQKRHGKRRPSRQWSTLVGVAQLLTLGVLGNELAVLSNPRLDFLDEPNLDATGQDVERRREVQPSVIGDLESPLPGDAEPVSDVPGRV